MKLPKEWRRARRRGELTALTPKKRGRRPMPVDPRDRKIAELERQLAQMTVVFQDHSTRVVQKHPATPAVSSSYDLDVSVSKSFLV